jgi:hypothetical protein
LNLTDVEGKRVNAQDKELLELAAKAAGIDLRPMAIKPALPEVGDGFIGYMADPKQCPRGWFNPLDDDGDALRLAVKLRSDVTFNNFDVFAFPADGSTGCAELYNVEDPCAAARRAIVRVAAEMGKALP